MTVKSTIYVCDLCGNDFTAELSPYWPSSKNACTVHTLNNKNSTLLFVDMAKDAYYERKDYNLELHPTDYNDLCQDCIYCLRKAMQSRIDATDKQNESEG